MRPAKKNIKLHTCAKFEAFRNAQRFAPLLSLAFSLLLGQALASPVVAQNTPPAPFLAEARVGILGHDVPGLWSGWRIENKGPDLNGELIFAPEIAFLGGRIRPALGGAWNTHGGTSKGYLDARWEYQTSIGIFFGLGLGAAVHNGVLGTTSVDHKALGRRVLFHIPLELGYRFNSGQTLSVYFDHMSNGYTQRNNEGLDTLGVRYGVRF
jgi:lipid A 3-O-deacylase